MAVWGAYSVAWLNPVCAVVTHCVNLHTKDVRYLHTTWNITIQRKIQVYTMSVSNKGLKIYVLLQQARSLKFCFSNSSVKLIMMASPALLFLQDCCSMVFSSTAEIFHPIDSWTHKGLSI